MGLVSCDSFLTESPQDALTEANAFTSIKDAEALIVSCYDGIQKGHEEYYMWYYQILSDCFADNAYSGGDDVDINNVGSRDLTPRNAVVMKSWKSLYGSIMRCNVALKYIPRIDDPLLDQEAFDGVSRREEMLGEASFLRALHYFNLVRTWGCVPLITTTGSTAPADVQVARSDTEEEVYTQIIADLEYALSRLPDRRSTEAETRGLASKGAVNALFARMYATKGAPGNVEWEKVKAYSEAVMASPVYRLVDTYDHLFDDEHRNNSETILAVQYIANSTENNYVPVLLLPPSMTEQNWRKYLTPSQSLLKAFEDEGDEVRRNSTVVFEDINNIWFDQYYVRMEGGQWTTRDLPFAYKCRAKNRVGWDCGDLIYIFRLADIVLLRAEAVNALSGPAEAIAEPNLRKIRTRVGLAELNTSSKEELTRSLLKERRLELAYEGERFFDLKRHGVARSTLEGMTWTEIVNGEQTTVTGHFADYMSLMPIPQEERDRNPNLTQNPGYN
jgi:hypothetical protein